MPLLNDLLLETDALSSQNAKLLDALELAQAHLGWCWDLIEKSTTLKRQGSIAVLGRIANVIEEGEAFRRQRECPVEDDSFTFTGEEP